MAETDLWERAWGAARGSSRGWSAALVSVPSPVLAPCSKTVNHAVPQFPLCAGGSGALVPSCPEKCTELW